MKYKCPKGVTSVSVGGDAYNVGRGGIVEIPDEKNVVAMLAPHGIVPVDDTQAAKTKADETGEDAQPGEPGAGTPDDDAGATE